MVEAIIRHSTSTFTPSVILIKKKKMGVGCFEIGPKITLQVRIDTNLTAN